MTPVPEDLEVQAYTSIEGFEETSAAPISESAETDESTTTFGGIPTPDALTSTRQDTRPGNVAQEVGGLLREVLIQLREDLSRTPGQPSTAAKPGDQHDDGASETSSETSRPRDEIPLIPKVRKVNLEHFKNQFHEDDGRYIIDALVAGSRLAQEVREEGLKRKSRGFGSSPTSQPEFSAAPVAQGDGTIRRIRIRSRSILYYLSKLADAPTQLDGTRTFVYPFVPLLYFQEDMRRILNLLEAKWTPSTRVFSDGDVEASNLEHDDGLPAEFHKETTEKSPKTELGSHISESGSDITMTLDSPFDTHFTLNEFRSYVAFVDKDLSHLADKYRDTRHSSVTFEDLWLLFKPGEYVVATTGTKTVLQRRNTVIRKSGSCQASGNPH